MAFQTLPPLPTSAIPFMSWAWTQISPYFDELAARPLDGSTVAIWVKDWSDLTELIDERNVRLEIATTQDTTDEAALKSYFAFLDEIDSEARKAAQVLKQKLLESKLEPAGFEIPLRNMRSDAALYREENLPLMTDVTKLNTEYDKIKGALTVQWDGAELTLTQLREYMQSSDRDTRERAWRAAMERSLQDREALNKLWTQILEKRVQIAKNAGFDNFRDYQWRINYRFDYTPTDNETFHDAIAKVVTPAVTRLAERSKQHMGLKSLRPWDMDLDWGNHVYVDPRQRPPLKPYRDTAELESKSATIFNAVDPELGEMFESMRRGGLLDLENRKGKGPGAYCATLSRERRPFVFHNAVGLNDDVQTMLHEIGHAFHVFESAHLPYIQQLAYTSEIAEVASMAMELLATPYLMTEKGGFYSVSDANRAVSEHLETMLMFWLYMAVVDSFQHWVYANVEQALDPAQCDAKWDELWTRYIPFHDWSGLESIRATGWHRKLHIFHYPFYYLEYGLAQLGAAQVWRNALADQAEAVRQYRYALSLGGTRPLSELYTAAGAKLAFDAATLGETVDLLESKLLEMADQ